MKIEIKDEHIASGEPLNACSCPVALAVTEAFGRQAYVHDDIICIPDMNDLTFLLTGSAKAFVDDYDMGIHVTPFSFELNL